MSEYAERFHIDELKNKEEVRKFRNSILVYLHELERSVLWWNVLAKELSSRTGIIDKPIGNTIGTLAFSISIEPYWGDKVSLEEFLNNLVIMITILREVGETGRYLYSNLCNAIEKALNYAARDIGISFDRNKGIFYPSGARLLDETLVNENLLWLQSYPKVLIPFDKGLRELLQAKNDAERLKDVVTDICEALEAFARVVCNNKKDKDLSTNEAEFILRLNLNDHYKSMLKSYIAYANKFRHADRDKSPRPPLVYAEIEAFVYLTGLFIRLGIEKLKPPSPSAREV